MYSGHVLSMVRTAFNKILEATTSFCHCVHMPSLHASMSITGCSILFPATGRHILRDMVAVPAVLYFCMSTLVDKVPVLMVEHTAVPYARY